MTQQAERAGYATGSALFALWPIGLGTALSLMGDATLYTVLPTHPADAGIALASVGIVLSINRIIRLATNGPAGWLYDRLARPKHLFQAALTLGVISTIAYAVSPGLPVLLLGRLVWGLAWSGIWIGGNGLVLQMAPPARRGEWVGVYQVWFFFGSVFATFLGGVLTDAAGYRQALWIGMGISALGALAAILGQAGESTRLSPAVARLERTGRSRLRSLLDALRTITPRMWAVAAANGMNRLLAAGVVYATLGLVIQENIGGDLNWGSWRLGVATITGGLLASRTLVSLIGAPIAGVLSDRLGKRWEMLAASLLASALGIGLLAAPSSAALIAGTFLSAAASGAIQSLATTLMGDLSSARRQGANLGVFYTVADLGSAIGPLAAYALLPIVGLPVVYAVCAVLMLLVAGWVGVMRGTRPEPACT